MNRIYELNIKRLALMTLPTWLRRPLCGALIYAALAPIGRLLGELRTFRSATGYRLRHNGQVCKLRGVLNDEFDQAQRRITIEDGDGGGLLEVSVIHKRETGIWTMLPQRGDGAAVVHREGYGGTSGYDFWVNVPGELRDAERETRMRALINNYKLAGKRFAINYR